MAQQDKDSGSTKVRLDKWLWAARFYKTRSLAADEIDKGRVKVNGQVAKASREPRLGDTIEFRQGTAARTVQVRGVSGTRGPAPQAALLYEETAESLLAREQHAEQRRLAPEPANSIAQGRPTKRDMRQLRSLRSLSDLRPNTGQSQAPGWNDRWSASLDDAG